MAVVPASALLSAVGAAGTGYLLHRADIAAAGAGTAAVGLAVERLQTRSLRRRARRERWEWRAEREQMREGLDELRQDLADAHHTLNVLRSRIHTLHERTAQTPRPGLTELATRQRLVRDQGYDDAPTMPLRRIAAQPNLATPVAAVQATTGGLSLAAMAALAAGPSAGHPLPENPLPGNPLPENPLLRKPSTTAAVTARPTPAGPERRRPLVTLARTHPAAGDGWRAFEPATGHPARPAAAAGAAAAGAAPAGATAGAAAPASATPTPHGAQSLAGPGVSDVPTVRPGLGVAGSQPPIALGPLATPPHLPALPLGPAESVRAGAGLPFLPPGPRDPMSGPLAIIVDLQADQGPTASATLPPSAVDAMVWAAISEAEADELTVTLERLDEADRGGRHGHPGQDGDGTRPSGLVVVGASVFGDPEARARQSRHTA